MMRGINKVDERRLKEGVTDRYTAIAEQHIAHVTDTDGTKIRWSVESFLRNDAQATKIVNQDWERIERRMAKARGEQLPKASIGELVHHYNNDVHYSHEFDPNTNCRVNRTAELCYAEKVHMLCDGDDCSWFNNPDFRYGETKYGFDHRWKKIVPQKFEGGDPTGYNDSEEKDARGGTQP